MVLENCTWCACVCVFQSRSVCRSLRHTIASHLQQGWYWCVSGAGRPADAQCTTTRHWRKKKQKRREIAMHAWLGTHLSSSRIRKINCFCKKKNDQILFYLFSFHFNLPSGPGKIFVRHLPLHCILDSFISLKICKYIMHIYILLFQHYQYSLVLENSARSHYVLCMHVCCVCVIFLLFCV